ncbi:pyridoxal phosphate-dependent aminotransferase [Ectothiorhodospiraceae bacterium 2226]|nr:pyridoxal phosphate-dependent aminotransferase [Ectothiorhodospiraceae bacterium 2226]
MPAEARVAARAAAIEPFHVMALLGRARELEAAGHHVVHMEIGEPDLPTPALVSEAAARAVAEGRTHYTPSLGLPALREAIAGYYAEHFGVTVASERVIVTPGASGALLLAMAATLDPGDEVLLADPGYPCNRNFARLLAVEARAVPVEAAQRYQLTPEAVARHFGPRTRAVMVASPSNPTGTLIEPAALAAIARDVTARGAHLLVDEIYQGLVYEQAPRTALALAQPSFVINSFSKYFHMTGWRVGWLVVPPGYTAAVERLAQNLFLAAPTPGQYAALAALSPPALAEYERRRLLFKQRRDYLVPALDALGFEVGPAPEGAFYVYAGCGRYTDDSLAFALRLLEEAKVAVTPGVDFGTHGAATHLRFAYTTGMDELERGVARLERYLRGA